MKRCIAILLLILLVGSLFIIPVQADEPLRSKYYSIVDTSTSVDSGVLKINNYYSISSNTGFSSAEIHTYVERRILGIFWVKVDNGQPDKTWVATSTQHVYSKNYSLSLSQTGTYRVTAEYTFYGSSGSESITLQKTVTY